MAKSKRHFFPKSDNVETTYKRLCAFIGLGFEVEIKPHPEKRLHILCQVVDRQSVPTNAEVGVPHAMDTYNGEGPGLDEAVANAWQAYKATNKSAE